MNTINAVTNCGHSYNFKGTVGKSITRELDREMTMELSSLLQEATRNKRLIKPEEISSIKEKYETCKNKAQEFMNNAHKKSELIYKKFWYNDKPVVIYQNSELGESVTERLSGTLLERMSKILISHSDEELILWSLAELKTNAKLVKTKLGKYFLQCQGKKIEQVQKDLGMDIDNTTEIIEREIAQKSAIKS